MKKIKSVYCRIDLTKSEAEEIKSAAKSELRSMKSFCKLASLNAARNGGNK